jgi:hypothetical protein
MGSFFIAQNIEVGSALFGCLKCFMLLPVKLLCVSFALWCGVAPGSD